MGPRYQVPGPRLLSPGKHSCDLGPSILGPGSRVPDCYNYTFWDPNKDHKKRLCYVGFGPRSLIVLLVFGVLHGSRTIMVPQFMVAFCCNRSFFRVPERTVAPGGATILYGSLDCTAMFWIPSWVPDNYGPKKYSCIPRCNYTFWDPAKVFFKISI